MKDQIELLLHAAKWKLYKAQEDSDGADSNYTAVRYLEDLADSLAEAYNNASYLEDLK